jgi:hypothetical protein
MSNKSIQQTISFDRLCKLFGVEEQLDNWIENIYRNLDTDNTENEVSEAIDKYRDAILYAAEKLFGEHELELIPLKRSAWAWKIVPTKTWKKSAYKIIDTVNGVGMFRYDSLKDFLESGPYTERQAVLSHVGWIPARYEVYNGGKAKSLIMRRLQH